MVKRVYLNIFSGLTAVLYFAACGQHDSMDGNMMQMNSKAQEMLVLEEQHHNEVSQMQNPTEIIAAINHYSSTMTAKVDEMMAMNTNMMSSHAMMDEQDAMQIRENCVAMKEAIAQHLSVIQAMTLVNAMQDECTTHYQKMRGYLDSMESMMESYGMMQMMK